MRRGIFILGLLTLLAWGLASVGQPRPLFVVIDAGHGGEDTGALGLDGLVEKNLVLTIAQLIQIKSLNEPRLKIVLTRREDKYISPQDRIALANQRKADLYVSVHANYVNDPRVQGIETLMHQSAGATSRALAQTLQNALVQLTKANNRGIKSAPLYLRDAQMPAALIEVGFVTNPDEAYKLQQFTYRALLAEGILDGIKEYLKLTR